jgi:uncharacterized membrane protein YgdD (TMEM256/DUF423 family)
MQNRTTLLLAFAFGFLAVAIGAFGAHALKPYMDSYQLSIFETASRYHFYHSLALLAVALLPNSNFTKYIGWCFAIGILLFSGSLYLLSLKTVLHIEHWKFLGPITPLGGLFFLAAWAMGLVQVVRSKC